MNKSQADALVARRASKGHRADESAALLAELLAAHDGENLAHALVFHGFATERQAAAAVRP